MIRFWLARFGLWLFCKNGGFIVAIHPDAPLPRNRNCVCEIPPCPHHDVKAKRTPETRGDAYSGLYDIGGHG